ncbi:MAG: hypothetical protein ACE37F_26165 [Nannocystaceae bacterium]|nr:hypothetical protein [bacterium]
MILSGCGDAADDAGPTADRWGRSCYYSTGGSSETTFAAKSKDNGGSSSSSKTDEGFQLTMKAGATASELDEMVNLLTELRFDAAVNAAHFHEQSCLESDKTAEVCSETCGQMGLQWDNEVVVCETCKIHDDGTIDCPDAPPSLGEALRQPWYGDKPWVFQNEDNGLAIIVEPPRLGENDKGELVWIADVTVHGLCFCACAG